MTTVRGGSGFINATVTTKAQTASTMAVTTNVRRVLRVRACMEATVIAEFYCRARVLSVWLSIF